MADVSRSLEQWEANATFETTWPELIAKIKAATYNMTATMQKQGPTAAHIQIQAQRLVPFRKEFEMLKQNLSATHAEKHAAALAEGKACFDNALGAMWCAVASAWWKAAAGQLDKWSSDKDLVQHWWPKMGSPTLR